MNKASAIFSIAPLFFLILFLVACQNNSKPKLTITQRSVLDGVASASAIAIFKDSLYVIGDDVPWIYRLNKEYQVQSKLPFGNYSLGADSVIPKPQKPDLEALTKTESSLIAFGSGSLPPQRDILVQLTKDEQIKSYSLQAFFDRLRSLPAFQEVKLNIEGATISKSHLFLFNRENNLVLQFQLTGFVAFIKNEGRFPEPKIFEIILPEINSIEAGLSGADIIPGTSKIIFTASVEDTPNPIVDGEILGSFVGIIDINDLQKQYHPAVIKVMKKDRLLPIKVESASVLSHTPDETEIVLVTDSDGGDSEIITAKLKWN